MCGKIIKTEGLIICLFPALFSFIGKSTTAAEKFKANLCRANENIIFHCDLKEGRKIISVCASADLSVATGYLQFRLGTQEKIEMQFPDKLSGSRDKFATRFYFRPPQGDKPLLTSQNHLLFETARLQYRLFYESTGSEKGDFSEIAGLEITGASKLNYSCKFPIINQLYLLKEVLREARE